MDRLTARSPKNNMAYLVNVKPSEQDVESPHPNTLKCIMQSFERLAVYEDIGLSPEEVKKLAEGKLIYESYEGSKLDKADQEIERLEGELAKHNKLAKTGGKNIPTPCAGAGATYGSYELPKNCCCENSLNKLKNTHYKQLPIDLSLMADSNGYGILAFDTNAAIACFEINFCPVCGRKLS
jgi:hypothetical protein